MSRWALDVTRLSSFCLAAAVGGALLLSPWGQAKEAQVSKDMEELRSQEPDSPVFKYLEQVCVGLVHARVHVSIYVYVRDVHGTYIRWRTLPKNSSWVFSAELPSAVWVVRCTWETWRTAKVAPNSRGVDSSPAGFARCRRLGRTAAT